LGRQACIGEPYPQGKNHGHPGEALRVLHGSKLTKELARGESGRRWPGTIPASPPGASTLGRKRSRCCPC
jgi:hypothetical protein